MQENFSLLVTETDSLDKLELAPPGDGLQLRLARVILVVAQPVQVAGIGSGLGHDTSVEAQLVGFRGEGAALG